ncbi:hypothetical protein KSF_005160 [Reticulibacter mediterranei]|uniref:Uncharacterized protein n=1 Tax=Reticulibacter mediterranei TaxID=2778369 RepID=A0A8J3IBA4_9CHLR|nr:hypothetical protein KSF_005160 [Reticulibacter mediterranei]
MIITHIQYTVRAGYAAENQEYIRRILEDLRALDRTDIGLSIFIKEDGKTFLHFLFCEHEEAEQTFFPARIAPSVENSACRKFS